MFHSVKPLTLLSGDIIYHQSLFKQAGDVFVVLSYYQNII